MWNTSTLPAQASTRTPFWQSAEATREVEAEEQFWLDAEDAEQELSGAYSSDGW